MTASAPETEPMTDEVLKGQLAEILRSWASAYATSNRVMAYDLREAAVALSRPSEPTPSEAVERWEVRPCFDHTGKNIRCYDICLPAEPEATGVAVIASVYSGQAVAQQIADAHNRSQPTRPSTEVSEEEVERLREALKPFADCVDQIGDDEDDEEWAKFRLLIKDYRRAKSAYDRGGK